MFYNNFLSLCEDAGMSPSAVLTELEISKGGLKRWRDGVEPTNPTKKKIADYFGISVKELSSEKIQKTKRPVTNEGGELDDEMIEMLEVVRRNPELRALFSVSTKATPDDIRKTIAIMKMFKGESDEGSHT